VEEALAELPRQHDALRDVPEDKEAGTEEYAVLIFFAVLVFFEGTLAKGGRLLGQWG
jgi:hypothetical protein